MMNSARSQQDCPLKCQDPQLASRWDCPPLTQRRYCGLNALVMSLVNGLNCHPGSPFPHHCELLLNFLS